MSFDFLINRSQGNKSSSSTLVFLNEDEEDSSVFERRAYDWANYFLDSIRKTSVKKDDEGVLGAKQKFFRLYIRAVIERKDENRKLNFCKKWDIFYSSWGFWVIFSVGWCFCFVKDFEINISLIIYQNDDHDFQGFCSITENFIRS